MVLPIQRAPVVTSQAVGESSLGRAYRIAYEGLCGSHPNLRPWHFQWLDGFYLYRGLRRVLPSVSGRILDAGCGDTPYRQWFGPLIEYVGLDIMPGPKVDILVAPGQKWPIPDEKYDALISSQVLEHVEDLEFTLGEMDRVLRPGGTMILTVPFLYNEHGTPLDFQRFTEHRVRRLYPHWEVAVLERQGGIGSTVTILLLNWIEQATNRNIVTRFLKGPLLPIWMMLTLFLNVAGLLLDRIDNTGSYYSNIMAVLRK